MSGPLLLPTWEQLAVTHPTMVDTLRRYLEQVACVLRPGSVKGADLALRSFATFLVEAAPQLVDTAEITRRHVEDYKPWLAKRPGQNNQRMSPATLAHRLGTLRMCFVRIEEWGWEQAPARIPMFPRRSPQTRPSAAQGPRRRHRRQAAPRRPGRQTTPGPRRRRGPPAHRTPRQRVHRPARRRGRPDRRRPLAPRPGRQTPRGPVPAPAPTAGRPHRHLPHRARRDRASAAVAPGERPGTGPTHGHPVPQQGRSRRRPPAHPPAPAAPHPGHPGHQPRHVTRSDRRDARTSQPGHDPALRQGRQPHLADEYSAVTDKVEALYQQTNSLPADAIGPKMVKLRREHHRLLGNGHCTRPPELDCAFESICETCTFFQTSIEFRPTLQAQHDDAATKGQDHRADLFTNLLNKVDGSAAS